MTLLHRMILRMLPGPFIAAFGTLMFLMVLQFLMRYLPDIAGKGLPLLVIAELVIYNLAYMVVLAVPMSVLLATLSVFGRLSESKAYVVIKNAGVSLPRLIWPLLLLGCVMTGVMWHFNNVVLPEANFRARNLWSDIRVKKPGLALQPGMFYDGIQGYSIRALEIPPDSDELRQITIFDHTEGGQLRTTITARRGQLESRLGGRAADLILFDGEVHRLREETASEMRERYEKFSFDQFRMQLDLADFAFERTDSQSGTRSDRTMRTSVMVQLLDSLDQSIARRVRLLENSMVALRAGEAEDDLRNRIKEDYPRSLFDDPVYGMREEPENPRPALAGLSQEERMQLYFYAQQRAREIRNHVDGIAGSMRWESQRANRYRVEIHKKYSIAFACLIFVLIGAPVGLSVSRGGLGMAGALSVVIFLFYWITLVQGEKFADRGYLEPWVGMWAANIVTGALAIWVFLYVSYDLRTTRPLQWLREKISSP